MQQMGNDVPKALGPSWFKRMHFRLTGLVLCAWYGKLDRYSYLLAQAYHECRPTLDGFSFMECNNPWGMHAGALTPRRKGSLGPNGPDGDTAVYGSLAACWADRIAYDKAKGVSADNGPADYFGQLVQKNWLGSNATPTAKAAMVAGCIYQYEKNVSWMPKMFDNAKSKSMSWWLRLALCLLILGVVITVIYYMVKGAKALWKKMNK